MSHGIHTNEQCHTYVHAWMSQVTHTHTCETSTSEHRVYCVRDVRGTYESRMSLSFVPLTSRTQYTHECVTHLCLWRHGNRIYITNIYSFMTHSCLIHDSFVPLTHEACTASTFCMTSEARDESLYVHESWNFFSFFLSHGSFFLSPPILFESQLQMSHVTRMTESCHTYEWVMSHIGRVMSRIWLSHATRVKE